MIQVKNLSIKRAESTLVSNLNAEFKNGELWAVIGKNGVGKTTFLNTIAGLYDDYEGVISINNKQLNTFDVLSRAQNIAVLPQVIEASLNCTVKQSITYGRYPWHKNQTEKLNDAKKISNAISAMKLNNLEEKSIKQLSGGELRKVEIATILAQDSEIILLDEPLNHLDVTSRYNLMELLKNISKNKIIIMITHDIQYVLKYCSNVIIIYDEHKSKIGSTKEVMTKKNINDLLGSNINDSLL